MSEFNIRMEVMKTVEPLLDSFMEKYLVPIDTNWQPTDLLPDASSEDFYDKVRELRNQSKELGYDFWVTLVGDTITEEALPTYESWLVDVVGIDQKQGESGNGWAKWVRHWTAEENRHGDVLNKFLYLSGRVNMREVEVTTQHLIADGFDPGTDRDPYKNFIFTSFQELATNISHKRVAKLASDKGSSMLAKICKIVAGDEMRHYLAYREFCKVFFEYDPSQMMIAFADMMKKKIVMPANLIRESGNAIGTAYVNFSNSAQRIGVYTNLDYIAIMKKLVAYWDIENITKLDEAAEKARDYLVKLPARLERLADRFKTPEYVHEFKWVEANGALV